MTKALVERLEAMLAAKTDNLLLRYTLGKLYAEQEEYTRACAHLEAALGFDPDYSVAWKWLGRARDGLGDAVGARQAWESGLAAATRRGDAQVQKELTVFIKRLDKRESGPAQA